ncbi:MAG: UbiD family decarboxylase [Pseudorhodoplanes sp.]|nr:MAG: UbiD family decarboxylase [Pseudorhodoplanes sp.]
MQQLLRVSRHRSESCELVDIGRPVDRQYDVAKVLKRNCAKRGQATVLTNSGTQYPLAGGRYSTRSQALPAVQATGQSIFEKVKVLMRLDHPVGPTVTGNGALCQEEVLTGDQIDLTCFAVPVYSLLEHDPEKCAAVFGKDHAQTKS